MKSLLAFFRMQLVKGLQYRTAAWAGVFTQFFWGFMEIQLYRALYAAHAERFPMALGALVSYIWLRQAFLAIFNTWSYENELFEMILSGNVAYELCRPVELYGYYFARIMAQKLLGSLLRAAPMLLFAFLLPRGWGLLPPVSLLALGAAALALGLGLLCMCAMENIIVAVSMRTLDFRGASQLMTLLITLFGGNILPLTLFPDAWQRVITALPYAQMLDAPIRLYTGQRALSQAPGALALQAFWVLALMGAGLLLWRMNQKKMIVQGG